MSRTASIYYITNKASIESYDTTNHAWYSTSNLSNGYADSTSTTYAQINLTRNADAETYIYWLFPALSSIPANASIDTVTCKCKCSISSVNASRVASRQAQLYTGTTAKGTAYNVQNSTNVFTITAGTSWTRAELQNLKIRLYAKRGTSNVTTSYYFRFYGADVEVLYYYNGTLYSITATSNVSGVNIVPASKELFAGETTSVLLDSNTDIIVTDNNADVTSSLVRTQNPTCKTIPTSCTDYTFEENASYPISNGFANITSATNGARFKLTATEQYASYSFDTSVIPSNATIVSVSCQYRARLASNISGTLTKKIQLYSGSTAKGNSQDLLYYAASKVPVKTIENAGTWSASEIRDARIRITGMYNTTSTYNLEFYGAELTVIYTISGYVYVYTMSNLAADHVILVKSPGPDYDIRVKQNGVWVQATKVLVKNNGSWVEASAIKAKSGGSWH